MRVTAFVLKGPVPKEKFFDREEELNRFKRELEVKNYTLLLAIIAPFKFGKTSLMMRFYEMARENPDVLCIYINFLELEADPLEEMIKLVKQACSKVATKEELKIFDEVLKKKRLGDLLRAVNELCEKKNKWFIFFMDEFQELARKLKKFGYYPQLDFEDIYKFIRGIHEKPTSRFGLVVAGSVINDLKRAISVWNGRFFEMWLGPFPREKSIEMLMKLFDMSGMKVSKDIANYIASSVYDHPYYMQLFGHTLALKQSIDEKTLEEARKEVEKFLRSLFDDKITALEEENPMFIDALISLLSSKVRKFNLIDRRYKPLIIKLIRRGILRVEDFEVQFYDKMFERYLGVRFGGLRTGVFIPRYTSEYLVMRKLVFFEGFRYVAAYYASWGPFDIRIDQKIGNFLGIGLQVRETSKDSILISRDDFERMRSFAKDFKLIPVVAVVYVHRERAIKYYLINKERKLAYESGLNSLRDLLKNVKIKDK